MKANKGRLHDWEAGATVTLVLALAKHYGDSGMPLGTLLTGYVNCVRVAKWNRLQQFRQERYLCAIVDALYVHGVITSSYVQQGDPSGISIIAKTGVADSPHLLQVEDRCLNHPWVKFCFRNISSSPVEPGDCDWDDEVTRRLCRRICRAPKPYEMDSEQ